MENLLQDIASGLWIVLGVYCFLGLRKWNKRFSELYDELKEEGSDGTKDKADEIALKLMRLADLESLCSYTRLRELAEADKAGRLVVLPYKVGQRVFALLDTDKHISECEVKQIGLGNEIGFVGLEPIGARGREYGVSLNGFGKTVFLTREEAEKAMEAMK